MLTARLVALAVTLAFSLVGLLYLRHRLQLTHNTTLLEVLAVAVMVALVCTALTLDLPQSVTPVENIP